MSEAQHLIDRFMRYVAVSTQSNSKAVKVPSNPNEIKLAEILAKELTAMGFTDVEISEFGSNSTDRRLVCAFRYRGLRP